jgi:hypothetical protein
MIPKKSNYELWREQQFCIKQVDWKAEIAEAQKWKDEKKKQKQGGAK